MQGNRPIVCSVAGFDPCAGAGVLADIKTFEQLAVQGMAVISGYTVQTEEKCHAVDWRLPEQVIHEVQTLQKRYQLSVVKIGIVPNASFLRALVQEIRQTQADTLIVWDPVLASSSGLAFFDKQTLPELTPVLEAIDLITPNYPEYQQLKPYLLKKQVVLVKGGHHPSLKGIDVLQCGQEELLLKPSSMEPIFEKHGSGCVLSSAISSYLAHGETMSKACKKAKLYIERYLKSSSTLLGQHHHG